MTTKVYSKEYDKTKMIVINIYGDLANSLLFCLHQDTKSDSWEMEIGLSGTIWTYKNTKGSMGK